MMGAWQRAFLALILLLVCASVPVASAQSGTWLRLTMNQTQPIPSGPHTTLTWDTVSGSSPNWPQVTAPVTDIEIPVSGLWEVWIRDLDFGDRGFEVGSRAMYTRRNQDPYSLRALDIRTDTGIPNRPAVMTTPFLMAFSAGDTLELRVSHTAGVTLHIAAVEVWLYLKEPGEFVLVGVN